MIASKKVLQVASVLVGSIALAGSVAAQDKKSTAPETKAAAPAKDMKAAAPASSAAEQPHIVANLSTVTWSDGPPSLPKGVKISVLHGDPGKAGPFEILLKMPSGYKIPAHWHSQDENLVILTGTFYAGMGDKLDEKQAQALKPGSYVFMPAKMHHFAFAKGGDTVINLHGMGPFDITYIDPATDPMKAAPEAAKPAEKKAERKK